MTMQPSDAEKTAYQLQLIEETHNFPCNVLVKVIGRAEQEFVQRVVETIRVCQQLEEDPPYQIRETPNGRHVAVTLEPHVSSAEEVLAIYREVRAVRGVVMLL